MTDLLTNALAAVRDERARQTAKWGEQRHDLNRWTGILGEEYGEACKEIVELTFRPGADDAGRLDQLFALRTELTHLAAVAVQMIEQVDETAGELAGKMAADALEADR